MSNKTFLWVMGLFFVPATLGTVSFRMADPNSLLPLSAEEIVLGKPISLVISSDANEPWNGGLFIRGGDREVSMLAGRGQPNIRLYQGSCMDGSGAHARAMYWKDSNIHGFDFYSNPVSVSPGDWFVVDYVPVKPGLCGIEFYEYSTEDPNSWYEPQSTLVLENTPSRDFSGDGIVNFEDFSHLASVWLDGSCADPNWCGHRDLDRDGMIGLTDLLMFSDYWLWGLPGWRPSPGPADPNLIYRITDGAGAREITLTVGESVTLYIQKSTLEKDIFTIQTEAILSDLELGWIDNAERDPNNPSGCCTAQILASPRNPSFDWWGPGGTQAEGIQFIMANVGTPIGDGYAASFVYTATAAGDVTVSLVDYGLVPSALEAILIHQVEGMQLMSASAGSAMMSLPQKTLTESPTAQDPVEITKEETIEFLETIWEEDPQIRQVIDQEQWDTFMEQVKAEESTDTDD
jgi:hypothetical protein